MPPDLSLAIEFLGFLAAAALVALGVWKLSVKLLAAGGAAALLVWLLAAGVGEGEWIKHEWVSLRLRPFDAKSGAFVPDATVMAVMPSDAASPVRWRLPSSLGDPRRQPSAGFITVSLVVELRLRGSLLALRRDAAAQTEIVEQRLEIVAPGYRPWRGALTELLPDGWPTAPLSERPIEVRLDRE